MISWAAVVMADKPQMHSEGAIKKQTLEVGHMNAAKEQSNGPLRSRPLRSGPLRSGPVRSGPARSGTVRGPVRGGTVRGPVRSRRPTVVGYG